MGSPFFGGSRAQVCTEYYDDSMEVDEEAGLTIEDLVASQSLSATDAALSAQLDSRKLARSLAIPTSDVKVRQRLRQLNQPITCFGEREMDRRERLRQVLASLLQEASSMVDKRDQSDTESGDEEEEAEQEEEFYTEGSSTLLNARRRVAAFSLRKSKQRIALQRQQAAVPLTQLMQLRKKIYEPLKTYTNLGSQIGDDRPVSMTRFSPDGSLLATASWSGSAKLWEMPSAKHMRTLRGHTDKVGGLAWHPQATLGLSPDAVNLVSGAGDASVCLWSLREPKPLSVLQGHEARVVNTAFHPTGDYVGSASFDGTWRLWDVATSTCLCIQEGHSKAVYALDFQDDGALVASGGLDAIGRVWDVRTGRTAMILDGHAREILAIDFHPTAQHQCATASGDDTVRIWDLRMLKSIYTIPAHTSSVSDIRFFQASTSTNADANGLFLATAGYDGMVRIWSADNWQLLRSLHGDAGRVMSVDINPVDSTIVSGEFGRTFKLWGSL